MNKALILGATLSGIAAALHLGCIVFGASWYRFFGAGERIARQASAGSWYPAAFAASIAALLVVWSFYALSGAGLIYRMPFLRTGLCLITGVYLLRGVAFLPFLTQLPGRSTSFWLWSSAICFSIGLVHLVGVTQVWSRLSATQPSVQADQP